MSSRRAKTKRRSGHPARVAAQRAPETKKGRPVQNGRPRRSRLAPPRRSAPSWAVQLRARLLGAWQALLKAALVGSRSGAPQLTELVRADLIWAAATGLASAALFATALTGHTYLGDGPETVAGVNSLGILHDPGYPSYVLVAHMFTLLVPVGCEAFRVNLFSLVCASLSIAVLQLLARRLGTARWAASLGALTLAASAGFWFYSGFAKHDIFSGLLFLLSMHLVLAVLGAADGREADRAGGRDRARARVFMATRAAGPAVRPVRPDSHCPGAAAALAGGRHGHRPGRARRGLWLCDGQGRAEPADQLGRRNDASAGWRRSWTVPTSPRTAALLT